MSEQLFIVAADGDRAVRVVQDVVTDAAEYRSTYEAEATSPHHDHRCAFCRRQLNNRLARTRREPYHPSPTHLHVSK